MMRKIIIITEQEIACQSFQFYLEGIFVNNIQRITSKLDELFIPYRIQYEYGIE